MMNYNNVQQGYALLKKGLSSAVTVAASSIKQAADVAKEVAKDVAEDLKGITVCKHYRLGEHVASSGPWALYSAINKKPGAVFTDACVWILSKKVLQEGHQARGSKPKDFDEYYAQQRRNVTQMSKIKHPGVLRVLEPLEDNMHQMIFVTEPVLGTLSNVLSRFSDIPTASEATRQLQLSQLEIKYGLIHLLETLQFLHTEAHMLHCNINKDTLIITSDGSWKLAGFQYSVALDAAGNVTEPIAFEYNSGQSPFWELLARPPLAYTAPEVVGSWGGPAMGSSKVSAAADIFSLALVTAEAISGKQVMHVSNSVTDYRARIQHLAAAPLQGAPPELVPTLRGMLAVQPPSRPAAGSLASVGWFQDDMLLRALRFLDTILQRENLQKISFLKDLATFWDKFDGRLLRNKVLPPLLQVSRQ
jgi:SCY1-like protein 2